MCEVWENEGEGEMITKEQQETLADIFANSERPDKMRLWVDWTTNSVVVHYYDLDE